MTTALQTTPQINTFKNGYLIGNFKPSDITRIMEVIKRDS